MNSKQLFSRTIVFWCALAAIFEVSGADRSREMPKLNRDTTPIARDGQLLGSFAPVVEDVTPSVVNIYTTRRIQQPGRLRRMPFDEFDPFAPFREFFGEDSRERFRNRDDSPNPRSQPPSRTLPIQNLGSGVIVSPDGYILTNNHVVEGADEIRVALADGRTQFTAEVIGTDPPTDIAVLKVDATGLPAITIADSAALRVGDIVLAIGNPFNVGQTVTMGIVSATGRSGLGIVDYEDFIQTDASVNPGNSGGALVDIRGRLVGVNTAILSRTGANQGIGFAVPANMAFNVMERLVTQGRVVRGFLGVYVQPLTPDLADEFGLDATGGALVASVTPDSPADQAGILPGDVIIEFDGRKVQGSRELRLMVGAASANDTAEIKLLREGRERTIEVQLAELPGSGGTETGEFAPDENTLSGYGIEVVDLDSATRQQFQIPRTVRNGAVVAEVDPESDAYDNGVRAGDVILELDRQPVETAGDASRLAQQAENNRLLARIWTRGPSGSGGTRFVVIEKSNAESDE